jgi:hypothetical protein
MRVILINPWDQSVSDAEFNGDYRDHYRLLSGPTVEGLENAEVSCFDITSLDGPLEDHQLVVDDEGLLIEPQAYFHLCGRTFAGRGVILRDDDGACSSLTAEAVRDLVDFLPIGTTVEVGPCTVTSFDTPEEMFAFLNAQRTDLTGPGQ